jgi:putative acetyltransferase
MTGILGSKELNMDIIIRRAVHRDANGIIDTHELSIREICSHDYTPEQIQAWANFRLRPEVWCQKIDRDFMWVADCNGESLGFGHFAIMDNEVGEVLGLYLTSQITGKGIAKKIFLEILEVAIKHHLKFIELYSTITAKGFYESLGFKQSAGDTTIDINGMAIPCYPMKLELK